MRRWSWAWAAMGALLGVTGWWLLRTGPRAAIRTTPRDRDLMRQATDANLLEIELGRLALEKGSSEDVREFGRRMAEEHAQAVNEWWLLGAKTDVELPHAWHGEGDPVRRRLLELSGKEFDDTYIREMIRRHEEAIHLSERIAREADLAELRQVASMSLSMLEDHLGHVRGIARRRGPKAA